MKEFKVTIEDRMIFTFRTVTFRCETENEAWEKAELALGRWEVINKIEEVPDGT